MSIERMHTNTRMSQVVIKEPFIFLAGQVASDPSLDVAGQTQDVLNKVDAYLAEANSDKSQILSVTIYLRDIKDFQAMNAVWDAWVAEGQAPARACVEARLARNELLVEMTVTATR